MLWTVQSYTEGHNDAGKEDHHLREEAFLIKRAPDLKKIDASNNSEKGKINRFVQTQELTLGKNWKKMLQEEGRRAAEQNENGNKERSDKEEAEVKEIFPWIT